MAAPGPWILYSDFLFNEGKKLIDLSSDTFKIALFTSASSAINTAVVGAGYTAFAANGHEVSNANGYTTGGVAVTATWVGGGATATSTFNTTDPSWTASGAGITARAAVVYSDTATGKLAIAYCLLDSTPADVVVAAGNTLTISVANIFVESQT
jgi:hypothetical protein